jgi:SAM-dependent methyltransferase
MNNPDRERVNTETSGSDTTSRWSAEPYPDYAKEINQSIRFSGLAHDFFVKGKADRLLALLDRAGFERQGLKLLDIGCGVGLLHPYLAGTGLKITGVDVAEQALAAARAANKGASYLHYDGSHLPVPDAHFDAAVTICVMHHVPPPQWPAFLLEARRILRVGGALLVFEHNPWNPLTRLAVNRCPFDHDAVLLSAPHLTNLMADAGFVQVAREFMFFTPFPHAFVQRLESQICKLPLGAQYVVMGRKHG